MSARWLAAAFVAAAIPASAQVGANTVAYDYTAMYEALNPSIVKIHADAGSGSCVLVDSRGMIATNHHLLRNARYVAVEFSDGREAAATGMPMAPTRQTMEFKAEFQELKLFRDGQLIAPITPGRQITEQAISEAYMSFVDEAYSGWYVYAPSAFLSGKSYRIDIYDAREPGKVHKSITLNEGSKFIQQIRKDFQGTSTP